MSDNINNYPLYSAFDDTDKVKIYSRKNKFAPVALTLGDLRRQITGYDYYTEVDVTSAQLLDIGNTAVTLLAAPGANKYYGKVFMIFEYTYGTIQYTMPGTGFLSIEGWTGESTLINGLLVGAANKVCVVNLGPQLEDTGETYTAYASQTLNQAIEFNGYSGNPTNGNGIVKVKIWYTINTFG